MDNRQIYTKPIIDNTLLFFRLEENEPLVPGFMAQGFAFCKGQFFKYVQVVSYEQGEKEFSEQFKNNESL